MPDQTACTCSRGDVCDCGLYGLPSRTSTISEPERRPIPGTGIVLAVFLVAACGVPIWVPALVHLIARWSTATP